MTHTMNTPLPPPAPQAFTVNDTAGIEYTVSRLTQSRAPDTKSQKKVFAVLDNALKYALAPNMMLYGARDVLWDISGGFEELRDAAHIKAKTGGEANYVKHRSRAAFYSMLADWASASLDMTEKTIGKHQSSPAEQLNVDYPKDAEDDSDPYVKTATPAPRPLNDTWQKIASDLKTCYTNTEIARARDVFDRVVELVWKDPGGDICLVLEKFGDECAQIGDECAQIGDECAHTDAFAPTHIRLWDACVMISDELRADTAANTISAKGNYTTSSEPDTTPRNAVCHAAEPEDAGQMWEVCGDPHRALFYNKLHAEHWAREMFPTENADKRYARIQYRNVLKFPATLA